MWLLPDTELSEDIAEDFVVGDLAGNFAKVMHAFADVL